ncbi:hypothetical protein EDD21DRAFT_400370 [Dissophora ornata]|nr:hypothetical protein BGZ58_002095 [Dissophora ornata]KAI8606485.1 hypothetical protein EDD21DRAFT_400370 [Dissophora ornata]
MKALSFLSSLLILLLALSTQQHAVVHAGTYSYTTPTGGTRWVTGQLGLVDIVLSDKSTNTVSVTLQRRQSDIFNPSVTVATLRDRVLLVVPAGATQLQYNITDFVVPAVLTAGTSYFVRTSYSGFLGIAQNSDSADFQIVAPANTTVPTSTVLSTSTLLPTSTTLLPTSTTSTTPTPTLPAGQTCSDVQEQCAAQGRVFQNTTATSPCACGATLVVPTIVGSSAPGSIKSTVKSSFQNTGGPTAALAVLLLVVMTMF